MGAHAQIVERHHALIRDTFLKLRAQCAAEGLVLADELLLAETVFSKNALLMIKGSTPYNAVLGRTPAILAEFDSPAVSQVSDGLGGECSKNIVRVRELALQTMIESTAVERIKRASATQARPAGEQHQLSPGDSVDVFRTPKSKEATGWRGPARVLSIQNVEHGYVDCQWQGRAMSVRIADVRRSLNYVTMIDTDNEALTVLQVHCLQVSSGLVVIALVLGSQGWQLSKEATKHPHMLRAAIHVGFNTFGLKCLGCRMGQGVATLQGMTAVASSVLLWWPAGNTQDYRTVQSDGSATLQLKSMFGDNWLCFKFIQFLGCFETHSKVLRELMPELGEDPRPHPQHVEPPHVGEPDEPMDEGDDEMDDVVSSLPSAVQPISTGTTRREAVSSASSRASSVWPKPYPKPFNPPAGWNAKAPMPKAVDSEQSGRTRTPYPTSANPPGARSKSKALAKALRRPPARPGSSTDVLRMQVGKASSSAAVLPHAIPVPTGSSWGSSVPSTLPPVPCPSTDPIVLPFHDSDSEDEAASEASETPTVLVESGAYVGAPAAYLSGRKRSVLPRWSQFYGNNMPCFLTSVEAATNDQSEYLAEQSHASNGPRVTSESDDSADWFQVEFSQQMSWFVEEAPYVAEGEVLVAYIATGKNSGNKTKLMVEKSLDNLTAQDVKTHWPLVETAIRKEIKSFNDMKVFELQLRHKAQNVCTSRWVHKFKIIDGERTVKSRLTIRGFQDLSVSEDNFAGTATRWGQRIIASVAVQKRWPIWVADVSTAFLRSMSFEQIAEMTGTAVREVSFCPPTGSDKYWQELPGMSHYTPLQYVLRLLKPAYGLKDAPRAWKLQLERVLRLAGGHPLHTDRCLWAWFVNSSLALLLSTHVDDLKGCGEDATTKKVLAVLEREFGALKTSVGEFEHCGVKHSTCKQTGSISLSQNHYAQQLVLMDHIELASMKSSDLLAEFQVSQYLSLLGGLSWLIQTRTDIAVYVCALQRAAKSPKAEHALRLNKVVKWAKRKPQQILYKRMRVPTRVMVISDSAFRKEDTKGLAMRGALIGINELQEFSPAGVFHLLEFFARKQRRVTRSTYSAELNAASDAFEFGKLIALTVSEIIKPYPSISSLMALEERGEFGLPVQLAIDARSVFDSLRAHELKAPTEISLIMFLCQLKEALLCHSLRTLWWVATEDMLADALNKGACSRQKLLEFSRTGEWRLEKSAISHTEVRHVPILSQAQLVLDPAKDG